MKYKLKNVLLGSALVAAAFVTLNVDAVTIKETTNTTDKYDTISDGAFIIGATKFEGVTLTAARVSKATYNEVALKGLANADTNVYYMLVGDWYAFDDEGAINVVTKNETLNKLNNADIYFVNNKEKLLEIAYDVDFDTTKKDLVIKTNKVHGGATSVDKDAMFTNGKLLIPATAMDVEVYLKDKTATDVSPTDLIDAFEKTDDKKNESTFELTQSKTKGTIAWDAASTGAIAGTQLSVSVADNTVKFVGTLKYYKVGAVNGNTVAGNFVGVTVSQPTGYTSPDAGVYPRYKLDDEKSTTKFADAALPQTFYLPVTATKKTTTITVDWSAEYSQVFTVDATGADLEAVPAGTIAWNAAKTGQKTETKDGKTTILNELAGTVSGNTLTFAGTVAWYEAGAVHADAGNYVAATLTAPTAYSATSAKYVIVADNKVYNNATHEAGKEIVEKVQEGKEAKQTTLAAALDAGTAFTKTTDIALLLSKNVKSYTVYVQWEKGNVQTFVVNGSNVTLEAATYAGTIAWDSANTGARVGKVLTATVSGETIRFASTEATGGIAYDNTQTTAGNYVGVTITAPKNLLDKNAAISSGTTDTTTVKVKVNGAEHNWIIKEDDATTASHDVLVNVTEGNADVVVTWETGNKQTFTVDVTAATLQAAPAGEIEYLAGAGADQANTVTGNTLVITKGKIAWTPTQGNVIDVQIAAPTASTATYNVVINRDTDKYETFADAASSPIVFTSGVADFNNVQLKNGKATIEVEWKLGNVQTFVIDATAATIEAAPQGVIAAEENTAKTSVVSSVSGNTLTFSGIVANNGADHNVSAAVAVPEAYSSANPSIKLTVVDKDGNKDTSVVSKSTGGFSWVTATSKKPAYLVYTYDANKDTDYVEFAVTWEAANVQTFKVDFNNITLGEVTDVTAGKLVEVESDESKTKAQIASSLSGTESLVSAVVNSDDKVISYVKLVSISTADLEINKTLNLGAKLSASVSEDKIANKTVTWSTSDASIVDVNPTTGVITAKGYGKATDGVYTEPFATITATTADGKHVDTIVVTVKSALKVAIAEDKLTNGNKLTLDLVATVTGNEGEVTYLWKDNDVEITNVSALATITEATADLKLNKTKTQLNGIVTNATSSPVDHHITLVVTDKTGTSVNAVDKTYTVAAAE